MDHSERWFEANASKLGGKHFDKKYGQNKEENGVKDADHFDYEVFKSGGETKYFNPRTKSKVQTAHRVSRTKIVFWDFVL